MGDNRPIQRLSVLYTPFNFKVYTDNKPLTYVLTTVHPRRPRGSQSSREERRDESFQAQAEEPLGTDSLRTISKRSSECWLLIGHKKCFVLLCPIGEQHLLSSFREFVHDATAIDSITACLAHAPNKCTQSGNFQFEINTLLQNTGCLYTRLLTKTQELLSFT